MNFRIAVFTVLCPLVSWGQQLSISGTVRDEKGVVPQTSVSLRSPSGGRTQANTDSGGQYRFENLISGAYELSFKHEGFDSVSRTLSLTGESRTVDVALTVGGIATSVDVTDVADKTTSSRMEVADREIPGQVSVVSQQTLQEQGINDLASALENVSGVSVQVQYGVYEWYTVDGFAQQSGNDFLLKDGMILTGNRNNTQLNNIQEVQVIKGPAAVLYGGAGASMGGLVNVISKKPQAARAYDLQYKVGRFGRQEVAAGATGSIFGLERLLYRVDTAFSHTDGWRGAGSDRFNISPSLLWLINNRMRISFEQTFLRDHYTLDGGVPLAVLALPNFPLDRRFNTSQDFEQGRDWQNTIAFTANITNRLTLRNSFFKRRNNDQYYDAETLAYVPATNSVSRSELYFKHHRRPVQNQTDIMGTYDILGMRHTFLVGYEYSDQYNYTDRSLASTAIPAVSITSFLSPGYVDPYVPLASFPRSRVDYTMQAINAEYWQDQINVTKRLHINVSGRYDDWKRRSHNDPYLNDVFVSRGPEAGQRHQTNYSYRAGAVFEINQANWVYFASSTGFHPVNTIPADGKELVPQRSRSFEIGHKFQGLNGRLTVNSSLRKIINFNLLLPLGNNLFDQAGQATSKVADLDIEGDLGRGTRIAASYGFAQPLYDDFRTTAGVNLKGRFLQYAPRHTSKVWLTKRWKAGDDLGLTSSIGMRYMGSEFLNQLNTVRVGGYTVFSGALGIQRKKYGVTINAENMLNRGRYFVSQINAGNQLYPGSPINVFATVRYRF